MLSPIDGGSKCVGAPDTLGIYFAESLFRDNMPIEWAKIVAAYLVRQVKIYCSGYAGGSTHLWEIPDVGESQCIDNKGVIAELESYLANIDGAMQIVLPDKRTNTETARQRAQQLSEVIQKIKKNFVLVAEPAEAVTVRDVANAQLNPQPHLDDPESERGR